MILRTAHRAIRLAAACVVVASLAMLVWFVAREDDAERLTAGRPPTQFYRLLDADLLDDYGGVFGSAHNAGDDIGQLVDALRHGADAIEVDVMSIGGRLVAAHDRSLPYVGSLVFRGPSLDEAWNAGQAAGAVLLDLKQSDSRFVDEVVQFLAARHATSVAGDAEVVVMSPSRSVLADVSAAVPSVLTVLSVASSDRLTRVMADPQTVAGIDGLSVREVLVSADLAAWAAEHDLLLITWVVDDATRLNELVRLGVDVVATDNLAILELLGAQERGEAQLAERRTMSEAVDGD